MATLLLTRSEVERLIDPAVLVPDLCAAFRDYSTSADRAQRVRSSAGAHITTLGADEPGKCEVGAEVMREALVVCDDRDLAVSMGAVGGAGLGHEAIAAELGEVLAGTHPGRTSPSEITVYGAVGLAFQDLVVAWQVYRRAGEGGWPRHRLPLLTPSLDLAPVAL